MKVRSSIRKICPTCKLVRRGRKNIIICSNGRHKQRQGFGTLAALMQPMGVALAFPVDSAAAAIAELKALVPAEADEEDL